MDQRDYNAELACLDAYLVLRDKVVEALSLLHSSKINEAEATLSSALKLSRMIYTESCDAYFLREE